MTEHLAALRREGDLLGEAAARTALDAPIPTTPKWTMRALVRHIGDVHRWAAAHVAEGRSDPIGKDELPGVAGPLPDDADLLGWFRAGHAALVSTLETAPHDTECWAFLPAPSPVAFWARRQAHETAIHRADAESPGGAITPVSPPFAVDGIDELLFGFFGQPYDGPNDSPVRTLRLLATDTGAEWMVRIGPDWLEPQREPGGTADCAVTGLASDLYHFVWNRRGADGLGVDGDDSLLSVWRDHAQIHWSRER